MGTMNRPVRPGRYVRYTRLGAIFALVAAVLRTPRVRRLIDRLLKVVLVLAMTIGFYLLEVLFILEGWMGEDFVGSWPFWALNLWPVEAGMLILAWRKGWIQQFSRRLWRSLKWVIGITPADLQQGRPRASWSGKRLYWTFVTASALYCAWRVFEWSNHQLWLAALITFCLVIWVGLFVKTGLEPAQPEVDEGQTLEHVARPHWIGFIPLLFQVGLVRIPTGWLRFLAPIAKVLRWAMGLGPIPLGVARLLTSQLITLQLLPNGWGGKWWWVALGCSSIWWILFAFSGWRKILYWSSLGPKGVTDGNLYVTLPRFTLLGVMDTGDAIRIRERVGTVKRKRVWGHIFHLDPGFALVLRGPKGEEGENVRYLFVDERRLPI